MFLWSHNLHNLVSHSLHYNHLNCTIALKRWQKYVGGLDSVFDDKRSCHRHGQVSNPVQGM